MVKEGVLLMSVQIVKWYIVTGDREYLITEKEKDNILDADNRGARFIQIDKAVINIAFIKEIYRKIEYAQDIKEVSSNDMKFLSTGVNKQLT